MSELLSGEKIPLKEYANSHVYQNLRRNYVDGHLSIGARNDWFHGRMKGLLRVSDIKGLPFLSGEACTHRHKEVTRHEGKVVCTTTHEYTVLTPDFDEILSSIDRLCRWCLSHPEVAAELLDTHPNNLASSAGSAFFTSTACDDEFNSGADFAFCVLRTIGDLIRFAGYRARWAIFHRELYPEFPSGEE